MTVRGSLFSILCHGAAAIASASFLIVVSIATYFICAAIGNDAGGPMVSFLISLFCILGGIGMVVVIYFPFSVLGAWVSRCKPLLAWVSPLLFFILTFLFFADWLVFLAKQQKFMSDLGLAAICSLFISVGFTIYWVIYWLIWVIGKGFLKGRGDAA